MRTQSESTTPPEVRSGPAGAASSGGDGRHAGSGTAARRRGPRGRHRAARGPSPAFLMGLGAAMIVAGALGAVAAVAMSVPWLWPQLGGAARRHPDTVLASVLLAASLAAVWRMSGPRDPRGGGGR